MLEFSFLPPKPQEKETLEANKMKTNRRNITIPSAINEDLAELAGIMFGDGNMYIKDNHSYFVRSYGNSDKDKEFMGYLEHVFQVQFNILPKTEIIAEKRSIGLFVYSKDILEYLHNTLGIPLSQKQLISIPLHIKGNPVLLKAFIRGLFDTDGCVVYQKEGKYVYPLVKICTKFLPFAEDVRDSIRSIGIKCFICRKKHKWGAGYDVTIRNKGCAKFFEVIGSRNPRNINKWKMGMQGFEFQCRKPSLAASLIRG